MERNVGWLRQTVFARADREPVAREATAGGSVGRLRPVLEGEQRPVVAGNRADAHRQPFVIRLTKAAKSAVVATSANS